MKSPLPAFWSVLVLLGSVAISPRAVHATPPAPDYELLLAEEKPVPGMIAAPEQLIASLRMTNPKLIVLLAQVIPAGKFPKYAYIPKLNAALARLDTKLHTPAQPVRLVDQAAGFDWHTDTIADRVHPNAAGAAKMAQRWFEALQSLRPAP